MTPRIPKSPARRAPPPVDIFTACAFGNELMELARSFGAKLKTEADGFEFAEGVSVALATCGLALVSVDTCLLTRSPAPVPPRSRKSKGGSK